MSLTLTSPITTLGKSSSPFVIVFSILISNTARMTHRLIHQGLQSSAARSLSSVFRACGGVSHVARACSGVPRQGAGVRGGGHGQSSRTAPRVLETAKPGLRAGCRLPRQHGQATEAGYLFQQRHSEPAGFVSTSLLTGYPDTGHALRLDAGVG